MFGIFHRNIKSKFFLDTNFLCFASQKIQARLYSTAMTGNMELHSFPCVCVCTHGNTVANALAKGVEHHIIYFGDVIPLPL